LAGSSESKPPTTSKSREKSNGRQEKEKIQKIENKPNTPGPIKKSKSIANNIEKPSIESSTKSNDKQGTETHEKKEKNKTVAKGETPVNKNEKDGCVIG